MIFSKSHRRRGQAALEYLLLLTVAAVVVLVGLKANPSSILTRAKGNTEGYYNTVTEVIMGKNPTPINGQWCKPPKPDGFCECACPAPAFGGAYCVSDGQCKASAGGSPSYCGDGICKSGEETGEAGHTGSNGDLLTCFEDCAYQVRCDQCDDMIPSSACGVPCNSTNCAASQVCMQSKCGTACPGYKEYCQSNPLLCTSTCRCDTGSATPVGTLCGMQCGPYVLAPTERCFRYTSCSGTCSEYEMYVGRPDPACTKCDNGVLDVGETAVDCGGTCKSCCGNGTLEPGEDCDHGIKNGVPGDSCLRNCRLTVDCKPINGNYSCGFPTVGEVTVNGVTTTCIIPRQCDSGETVDTCKPDCTPCKPNGNCVAVNGNYACNAETVGAYENCPAIPCYIPKRCDPGETCTTCPEDCDQGTCWPNGGYVCGGPTQGHYSCSGAPCTIPKMCDLPYENCNGCEPDCGKCECTGATPDHSRICAGADQLILQSTPKNLVGGCSGAKCEYVCDVNYEYRSTNASLQEMCVCTAANCGGCGVVNVAVDPQCGGTVALGPAKDGESVTANCPAGCVGKIFGSCFNGSYVDKIWVEGQGWVGTGPIGTCKPATTLSCAPKTITVSGYTSSSGTIINCGQTTFGQTPASTQAVAPCGEFCDGYIGEWCNASGNWENGPNGFSGSEFWGCKLKTAIQNCPAPKGVYLPKCGPGIPIPQIDSGRTYTVGCDENSCHGGTISASCIDGVLSIRDNCERCGDGVKNGTWEVCDGDSLPCAQQGEYQACRQDCLGYEACRLRCDQKTGINVAPCGTVTLPPAYDGTKSSTPCPAGCSGTIEAVCNGTQFGAITGSCSNSFTWKTEAWGQCTVGCGGGTQNRVVTCINISTGAAVADSNCTGAKPSASQACNTNPCNCTGSLVDGQCIVFFDSTGKGTCQNGCTGTVTATCTTNGWVKTSGSCTTVASCPLVTSNTGCKVTMTGTTGQQTGTCSSPAQTCAGCTCQGTVIGLCGVNGNQDGWLLTHESGNCIPYCPATYTENNGCVVSMSSTTGSLIQGTCMGNCYSPNNTCPSCGPLPPTASCLASGWSKTANSGTCLPCADVCVAWNPTECGPFVPGRDRDCGRPCTLNINCCGNSRIDYGQGEECDGTLMQGFRCFNVGFWSGVLNCYPKDTPNQCKFDTSQCIPATCSDGYKNQGEAGVDCGGPCAATCPPCPGGSIGGGTRCTQTRDETPLFSSDTVECTGECRGESAIYYCGSNIITGASEWYQQTGYNGCWNPCGEIIVGAQGAPFGDTSCNVKLPKTYSGTWNNPNPAAAPACPAGCTLGSVSGSCAEGQWQGVQNSCHKPGWY